MIIKSNRLALKGFGAAQQGQPSIQMPQITTEMALGGVLGYLIGSRRGDGKDAVLYAVIGAMAGTLLPKLMGNAPAMQNAYVAPVAPGATTPGATPTSGNFDLVSAQSIVKSVLGNEGLTGTASGIYSIIQKAWTDKKQPAAGSEYTPVSESGFERPVMVSDPAEVAGSLVIDNDTVSAGGSDVWSTQDDGNWNDSGWGTDETV